MHTLCRVLGFGYKLSIEVIHLKLDQQVRVQVFHFRGLAMFYYFECSQQVLVLLCGLIVSYYLIYLLRECSLTQLGLDVLGSQVLELLKAFVLTYCW